MALEHTKQTAYVGTHAQHDHSTHTHRHTHSYIYIYIRLRFSTLKDAQRTIDCDSTSEFAATP